VTVKPPRWQRPPDRWSSVEESGKAAEVFLSASSNLILRGKPTEDCSDVELLGWRLAIRLQMAFQGVPDDSYARTLRRALEAFDGDQGIEVTRAWCVRAVAEWAEKWRQPDWQATDETRALLLKQFVNELVCHDDAFETVRGDADYLAQQLNSWDPAPRFKTGKKGSEKILAEIIVDRCEGKVLGFADDMSVEAVDAAETIRGKLADGLDAYLAWAKKSE
jgi:hypothetical protein